MRNNTVGEMVNRVSGMAAEWQRHVVWIRVNVAYITAELGYLSAEGEDVSDIKTLMESFEPAFELFCRNEMGVFVAARWSETNELGDTLISCLRRTRESFSTWLREYDRIVRVREASGPEGSLILLHSCGAELLGAHSRFISVIDACVAEIEPSTRPLDGAQRKS